MCAYIRCLIEPLHEADWGIWTIRGSAATVTHQMHRKLVIAYFQKRPVRAHFSHDPTDQLDIIHRMSLFFYNSTSFYKCRKECPCCPRLSAFDTAGPSSVSKSNPIRSPLHPQPLLPYRYNSLKYMSLLQCYAATDYIA